MTHRLALAFLVLPLLGMQAGPRAGIDHAAMDKTVDPCIDFYEYACGGWRAANPLPADRSGWGRFGEVGERNEKLLLDILQKAAVVRDGRSETDRKIGDAFAACLDTAAINRKGISPLKPELNGISAMSKNELAAEVARLHRRGVFVLFQSGSRAGVKDATHYVANVRQRGLSLPDRDYYLKTDPKSIEIRGRFMRHIVNMFQLAGDPPDRAAAKAQSVVDIETTLAAASTDRTVLRNPLNMQHLLSRAELQALWPDFAWDTYFTMLGAPAFDVVNVEQPDFLRSVARAVREQPLSALQAYFAFQLLHRYAPQLPEAFENEDFDFWNRYLTGAAAPQPRPHRCERVVDSEMPDLLGQKFIEVAFGDAARARMTQLLNELRQALAEDIRERQWMTDETKAAALEKLKAMNLSNVGRPPKWRDYSRVSIVRDDFLGNEMRATEAVMVKRAADIGKLVDKDEWGVNAQDANAFYFPSTNAVVLLAGILQPPFFDPDRDGAINYGAIGALIGHELTHGFDDQGRRYGADGTLRDWWAPADRAGFEQRAACFVNEYSGFTAIDEVNVNGRLTLAENTADNGGARIALMALENALGNARLELDGFTPEQRFFLGFAQWHCENRSPQAARASAMTDTHAPNRDRVNGTLQNMPEFQKAFSCKAGQPMVSAAPCRIW